MADNSKIEWTDATWNPIVGCSIVSPGCTNCYAMRLAGTRLKTSPSRQGLTTDSKTGPVWNGQVRLMPEWLKQPLHWRTPRMVFVCAHGDLFHPAVPDEWIDQVFAKMVLAPQHTFQILTKRPDRMASYLQGLTPERAAESAYLRFADALARKRARSSGGEPWILPNVWLGVSVEDQRRAEDRILPLLRTPAALRFVSIEPMLGPIDLTWVGHDNDDLDGVIDALKGKTWIEEWWDAEGKDRRQRDCQVLPRIDWVICGGESGPNARPMHPNWARSLRDQCVAADVPFFFKQNGEFASVSEVAGAGAHYSFPDGATVRRVGKKAAGDCLDGAQWHQFPVMPA